MPLAPSTRLGPYEIVSSIGAGGMGEVYRARDTRLDRTVAVKVLPEHLSSNPQLRERFDREAKAISSLSHPHICPLYDVGHQEGVDFLVMEFLEGETLAHRLKKGPLPPDQVLQYAIQITDALDTAHRHGVIHRDLKPGNIMLVKTGAKLLDFGLAKVRAAEAAADMTALPTKTTPLTGEGTILGTLQYMAPEQLEGAEADARTDIFALGAVIYEMATGRRAFEGKSQASLISAIMTAEPPSISTAQNMAPPALDHVVRICLVKEPEGRWQTAHDVLIELKWISQANVESRISLPSHRRWVGWAAASILALVLLVILYSRPHPPESPSVMLSMLPPENTGFGEFALAPDGRSVAFTASQGGKSLLWVRSFDAPVAKPLPDTDGATFPFWSADSRMVGFFATGKLKKIASSGGHAQTLADARRGRGGTWNREGVIVFAPDITSNLYRISSGSGATPVTQLDSSRQENSHRFPCFLPDGRHFLYYARSRQHENTGIYLGELGSPEAKHLLSADSTGVAAPSGYLFFIREPMLMVQRFRLNNLSLDGEPFAAAEKVWQHGFPGLAPFSVSENGVLAYREANVEMAQLTWFSRDGTALETIGTPQEPTAIALAPDEKRLAFERFDATAADIWLLDSARGTTSRFTSDPATDWFPVWSPDGRRIVFASERKGQMDLYQKPVNGSEQEELLFKSDEAKTPTDWSSDGKFIVYHTVDPKTKGDLWVLPLEGDRKPIRFVQTDFDEFDGAFSPDGNWIGYTSDETGRMEVYIQAFAGSKTQTPRTTKLQVSTNGGSRLRWRRNGTELFYVAPDGDLMSVAVKTNPMILASPKKLFHTAIGNPASDTASGGYAVAASGQRFLIAAPMRPHSPAALTVVLNWTAGLKR